MHMLQYMKGAYIVESVVNFEKLYTAFQDIQLVKSFGQFNGCGRYLCALNRIIFRPRMVQELTNTGTHVQ
jgi:hypothetical protein